MTLEAIKEAIGGLPDEDRISLASWLVDHDYDGWDQEMVRDLSPGGQGEHLFDRINREIDEGGFSPMSGEFNKLRRT